MRIVLRLVFSLLLATQAFAQSSSNDLVLVGGTIVDGSGKPRFRGNVRIRAGEIADVGTFQPARGEAILNVAGLIVAPGFIDIHNHSADALGEKPDALSQVSQGITTLVLGPDGGGPIGIERFMVTFDEKPLALNVLAFVGHANVRVRVMGANYKRAATPEEVTRMEELVEDAMREGAFGISSALEYDPGSYSTIDEVVALAKIAGRYGGIYMTHLRDEGDKVLDAIAEAIEVGRRANIPVQISHLKLGSAGVWGKSAEVLALIDKARAQGVNVAADVYPYNTVRSAVRSAIRLEDVGGPANVLIIASPMHPEYKLKTLDQIAKDLAIAPMELYNELLKEGETTVATTSISEKDLTALLRHAWAMISSDGGLEIADPRSTGAFTRVLSKIVREDKTLTLEVAVRKMSGLPASRLGLKERGLLVKGAAADIVVFDSNLVRDSSTLQEPGALSQGIKHVFVNGAAVIKDGLPTDARPGLALR